jgi:serine/threonine protein kinase
MLPYFHTILISSFIPADELRGLDWHTRYQIIKGISEGLHHLHKEKHIIHMDLKPSNVLLDDQMVPKIIDFGLSRLDDKSRTMTVERLITL